MTSHTPVSNNDGVNPDRLGRLTDEALVSLAEKMGLFLPPGLDRIFVIEEILEALVEESEERRFSHDAPGHVEEKKFASPGGSRILTHDPEPSAAVPEESPTTAGPLHRYGKTMIHAIARDPGWVFAYWDIDERQMPSREGVETTSILFLRVCELAAGHDVRRDYFDIPVSTEDFQWYINMPHPGNRYRIDLYATYAGKSKILSRSNEVLLPRQYVDPEPFCDCPEMYRLMVLSGGRELNIAAPESRNPCRILADGE